MVGGGGVASAVDSAFAFPPTPCIVSLWGWSSGSFPLCALRCSPAQAALWFLRGHVTSALPSQPFSPAPDLTAQLLSTQKGTHSWHWLCPRGYAMLTPTHLC